ncbi:MAG: sulfite exporter TauE/SafE family protein [Verrucomicrobiales bacterium]|nr:sulfite exporter TauE/SafE family protein [Verrucomicrobiota bacterium JB025]
MKLVITAALIGLCAGLLGALCGVGGGIVMVPAFVGVLGMEHKQAVATSMAVIVVTAIAATANNVRASDLVDWKVVFAVGVAAAFASWFGSDLMRSFSNQFLTRAFGVLAVVIGVRMLWKG